MFEKIFIELRQKIEKPISQICQFDLGIENFFRFALFPALLLAFI